MNHNEIEKQCWTILEEWFFHEETDEWRQKWQRERVGALVRELTPASERGRWAVQRITEPEPILAELLAQLTEAAAHLPPPSVPEEEDPDLDMRQRALLTIFGRPFTQEAWEEIEREGLVDKWEDEHEGDDDWLWMPHLIRYLVLPEEEEEDDEEWLEREEDEEDEEEMSEEESFSESSEVSKTAPFPPRPETVVYEIAEDLGRRGDPAAIPVLAQVLATPCDEYGSPRPTAARVLGQFDSPDVIPPLRAALTDEDPQVRGSAASALGQRGAAEAVPDLIAALQDEYNWVVAGAAEALGKLGVQDAIPSLLEIVKQRARRWKGVAEMGHFETFCVAAAAEALGRLHAQEAVPLLLETVQDAAHDEVFIPFSSLSDYRRNAAKALGEIGDPAAAPVLVGEIRARTRNLYRTLIAVIFHSGIPLFDATQRIFSLVLNRLSKLLRIGGRWRYNMQDEYRQFEMEVMGTFAEVLGSLGDPAAGPVLRAFVKNQQVRFWPRLSAAKGWLMLEPTRTREVDRWLIPDGPEEELAKLELLLAHGGLDETAYQARIAGMDLKSGNESALSNALSRLREQVQPRHLPLLQRVAEEERESEALELLGRVGGETMLPFLTPWLDDPDLNLRGTAAWAILNTLQRTHL